MVPVGQVMFVRHVTLICVVIFISIPSALGQRLPPGVAGKLASQLQKDWKDRPEWADMAISILKEDNAGMGQGNGWFKGSQLRYGFPWLQKNIDVDGDKQITAGEASAFLSKEQFGVLDRDRSGVLTGEDFDWSKGSPVFQDDPASDVFYRLDVDSNGRVTKEELLKFFDERASDVPFLTTEDLRDGLGLRKKTGQQPTQQRGAPPDSVRLQFLNQLLDGQMGFLKEGPQVDSDAPDFDLPLMTLDKKELEFSLSDERIQLSNEKGKRPVVLIFGSFT